MSKRRGDQPIADRIPPEKLLGIAEYHREHERFYSSHGLQQALRLRQDSEALKRLADRWVESENDGEPRQREVDGMFEAIGSPDLNDWAAIATSGVLFMEGEDEPGEITALKARLRSLSEELQAYGPWLAEKLDAAWQRESTLLQPDLIDLAYRRHLVLMRTTLHGEKVKVAGRLIGAAEKALSGGSFDPATIRADRRTMAKVAMTAGWLLDAAASLLAEQAAALGLADPDWTHYIEALRPTVAAPAPTVEATTTNGDEATS